MIPSGVGVIIGFDKRRDAEMAYVKGRIVDDQELDIEWNKTDDVKSSQVRNLFLFSVRGFSII